MPLVAVDTNIVDRLLDAVDEPEAIYAAEAMEARPAFDVSVPMALQRELMACYWLRSLSGAWTSTLYTFCDLLIDEVAAIPEARAIRRWRLLDLASMMRSFHPSEYQQPAPDLVPPIGPLVHAGINPADAAHLVAAVGVGADVFLTDDLGIIDVVSRNPGLVATRVERPSQFLVSAVRSGAPWPCHVDWPWLSLPQADQA